MFLVLIAKAGPSWRSALIVMQPDKIVRWRRHWLRRHWAKRSMQGRPGRPSTAGTIRTLIDKMCAANPLWGAPRIHGELVNLGIAVSERDLSCLACKFNCRNRRSDIGEGQLGKKDRPLARFLF